MLRRDFVKTLCLSSLSSLLPISLGNKFVPEQKEEKKYKIWNEETRELIMTF